MHASGRAILTASKDGCVVASELGQDGGVRVLHRWPEHHAGVAKCARWRGAAADVFASCGSDRWAAPQAPAPLPARSLALPCIHPTPLTAIQISFVSRAHCEHGGEQGPHRGCPNQVCRR